MKYGIIVDSGCDLISLDTKQIDFTRAPLKLDIGTKVFTDDIHLDIENFMTEMYGYRGKTGSAAPSPAEWLSAYEKSDHVFAITLTSGLSGSWNSAKTAADIFKEQYPERKIHLIDSKSAGPGITLIVRKLEEYIQQGLCFDDIVTHIDNYLTHTHLFFVLKSLDNLVKNGRVSRIVGNMAGLLGIKLIGMATPEGTLGLLKKCRGKFTAYETIVQEMIETGYNGGRVIVAHCFAEKETEHFISALREKFSSCEIEIMKTSGLCSYYAERGGILVAAEF